MRKISDPPLTLCPDCGRDTLLKQVTAAGFQLKGSGWYVTDFRDQGNKASAKPSVSSSQGDSHESPASSSDATKPTSPSGSTKGIASMDQATSVQPAPHSSVPSSNQGTGKA